MTPHLLKSVQPKKTHYKSQHSKKILFTFFSSLFSSFITILSFFCFSSFCIEIAANVRAEITERWRSQLSATLLLPPPSPQLFVFENVELLFLFRCPSLTL
ncbi:unnamed protein product [Meloidogyne enterolobii]|uniref:Uncharacterized protein n=1 Tax=Meloidogyne enterolobii TaxID=390850 RepID=A0ACB1AWA4_MELEN